jgi:hypothetical protein
MRKMLAIAGLSLALALSSQSLAPKLSGLRSTRLSEKPPTFRATCIVTEFPGATSK